MNKLIKKIEELRNYNFDKDVVKTQDELIAEEAKKLAIEFAKKLMCTEVCSARSGRVESGFECSVKYPHAVPPEYSLMYGELARSGDKLFDKFIEDYYAKV